VHALSLTVDVSVERSIVVMIKATLEMIKATLEPRPESSPMAW